MVLLIPYTCMVKIGREYTQETPLATPLSVRIGPILISICHTYRIISHDFFENHYLFALWKIEVMQYRITHEFFCYTRAIHSCTHVIHARCMDTIYAAFLYNN